MAETFENLVTILSDWGKIRYKKVLVEALNRYESPHERLLNEAVTSLDERTNQCRSLVKRLASNKLCKNGNRHPRSIFRKMIQNNYSSYS